MNIKIPRCIGETSIAYCIKKTKNKFGEESKISLICRRDEEGLFKNFPDIDKIEIINTKKFSKNTNIINTLKDNRKYIVILPVASLNTIENYNNVLDFIYNKIKYSKIYIYCFDLDKIVEYEYSPLNKLKVTIVGIFSFLISIPIFIILLIIIMFKYLNFKLK